MNPLSVLYKTVSFLDLQIKRRRRREFPGSYIISVDSLSFGGTGKTPLVMAIGQALEAQGARFAVISRGYRSRFEKRGILVESTHSYEEVGDEPLMLKAFFPRQDVFIGRDRLRSIRAAMERNNRILILDDGFQSAHIKKDCRLLLVHPGHPYFYLRHFRFLARRAGRVLTWRPGSPEAGSYGFTIRHFLDAAGREVEIGDAPLVAFSALGDNERFAGDLRRYRLAAFRPFPDHHAYDAGDLRSLEALRREKKADWMVCTEKDFFKIRGLLSPAVPLLYARNEIQLPGDVIGQIVQHAREKGFL
ncbi:MAG: tetraacyldisaccharide 4'-kinase [Candidatus Aminicenantes bacterium]|nr:tetraacyldisaccharide 4'-kinase [Candidatus Aminicenantes bacterium]